MAEAVMRAAAKSPPIRTLVSLGPGDARVDADLVRVLPTEDARLTYVPVDLSESLLRTATAELENLTAVPMAILADLEDRFDFVTGRLDEKAPAPRLFALLGNTLGNLDRGERNLMNSIRSELGGDDRLMISVATKGPEWTVEADPLHDETGLARRVLQFVALGLPKSDLSLQSAQPPPEATTGEVGIRIGTSGVPEAAAFDVFSRASGETVIEIRRYGWLALLSWLREEVGLVLHHHEEVLINEIDGAGVAVVGPP